VLEKTEMRRCSRVAPRALVLEKVEMRRCSRVAPRALVQERMEVRRSARDRLSKTRRRQEAQARQDSSEDPTELMPRSSVARSGLSQKTDIWTTMLS
jgi:hypothetical protein